MASLKCLQRVFILPRGVQSTSLHRSLHGNICARIVMAGPLLPAVETAAVLKASLLAAESEPPVLRLPHSICNAVVFLDSFHS